MLVAASMNEFLVRGYRFDRAASGDAFLRYRMISGLTLLRAYALAEGRLAWI